jgi:hypothetical protein
MMTENVVRGMYIVPVMENFLEIVVISQNLKDVNYLDLLQHQQYKTNNTNQNKYTNKIVLVSDLACILF